MATNISHNPAETFALGQSWGRIIQSGTVIGLCGDLGAGKTQLVKGLACGLDVEARVHSPTFALINVYSGGRLPLFHLDLYRLETPEQIVAAGLGEYLDPAGVAVIEWADRWFGTRPTNQASDAQNFRNREHDRSRPAVSLRWVQIEILSESERRISYEDFGA